MSSSGRGIGSTLTGGIQDIAAILPLLGTEQCSVHVSSALTQGYLYAAASPMSIFGSLGVVSAGFKTLVACFSLGDIDGAKILGNMGFEPHGENLSLIMVETGKGKNAGHYIVESRVDELIKELNTGIGKSRIIGISHKSAAWNVKMMATTALLCAFSIAPYIYLNQGASNLKKSTTWVFPVLRATGGFITATLIQLLIQRRITTLSDQYLVERDQLPSTNIEAAVESGDTKKPQMDAHTWLLLCLLLIGLVASVVGYVGCFSVVQNSTSTIGPVSWLCLEAGLSVMRLAIWAWNPTMDDAPPLEILLQLDKYEHKPLPTCNKDNEEILQYKVLPLTRARDFLKTIMSFAGLIHPFRNPDLSLYYTLTRKRPSKERNYKLGERILYITVFDYKEHTTLVYTRDNGIDTFYSTKSDAPLIDVGHLLLEVEIDAEINPKGDPLSSDSNNLNLLRKHYQSILEHIQYRLGAGDVKHPYAIEISWKMKVEDSISVLQRLREENEENEDAWKTVVEYEKEEERNEESLLICDYFMHSSIERERQLLDEKRVKWIARRMEIITEETKERFQGEIGVEYRVNKQAVEKKPATDLPEGGFGGIEKLLVLEQYLMELLLLYEVKEWEELFWSKLKAFLDQISNDRVYEKERLTREWRANCWKRLNPQMHAAVKRLAKDQDGFREALGRRWASSISQFLGASSSQFSEGSLSELRDEMEPLNDEIRLRMEKEIEDTEFRLKLGYDLGRFDPFWDDDTLFKCRYSRSKWLYLNKYDTSRDTPLEIYLHALQGNENIIHITFSGFDSDSDINRLQATICDLPRVTSISSDSFGLLDIHRDHDPLFIKSTNNDLIAFATRKEIRRKLDPYSTYIFTDAKGSDMIILPDGEALGNNARVIITFFAPISDRSLTLRLKHSGEDGPLLEVTLGSTKIQLNPSFKSSLTIDDITLHPFSGPSESDHLSVEPGIRNDIGEEVDDIALDPTSGSSESEYLSFEQGIWNNIVIQFRGRAGTWGHGHFLHDIELLDEDGLEYDGLILHREKDKL